MPTIDISQLAPLDEVLGGPSGREAGSELESARATGPTAPPDSRNAGAARNAFAPAGEGSLDELGVERSTRAIRITNLRERARAQAAVGPAVAVAPAARPRRQLGGVMVAVGLIVATAVGLAAFALHRRAPRAHGPGVEIRIVAPSPVDVMIDGHAAGRTPLTLQRPAGTQPILISAPHVVRQIVPDHDQLVELAPP